ncbi:MAG: hypothetical protein Fur003_4390 [Candidatus Dojkabacteria bacterium]
MKKVKGFVALSVAVMLAAANIMTAKAEILPVIDEGIVLSFDTTTTPKVYNEGEVVSFVGKFQDLGAYPEDTIWTLWIEPMDGTTNKIPVGTYYVNESDFSGKTYQFYVNANSTVKPILMVTRTFKGEVVDKNQLSISLNINNLVPVVNVTPASATVNEGTAAKLTANVTGGNAPYTYVWSGGCVGNTKIAYAPKTVGTYTCKVTVTDYDGDIATSTSTVKVLNVPDPVVNNDPAPVEDNTDENSTPEVLGTEDTTDEVNDDTDNKNEDNKKDDKKTYKKENFNAYWFIAAGLLLLLLGAPLFILGKRRKKAQKEVK